MSPSQPPRACEACGARGLAPDARYCERCGATLPSREPTAPTEVDLRERFQALREHPDFERWMERVPETSALEHSVPWTLFAMAAVGGLGGIATWLAGFLCPPLAIVPLAITAFLVYSLGLNALRSTAIRKAPLERVPVRIVRIDTRIADRATPHPLTTRHFVTVEQEDGRERTVEAHRDVARALVQGEIGLGYFKDTWLIEFIRPPAAMP